ncbi:hypothetical protein JHW43_007020 [Diplocarpon mali]|nr:hypothetical protein JHW43_007020 [Diplocarpon mali]
MRRRGCLPAAPIPRSSRLSNRSRGVSGETSRSATARHGVETGHRWIWSSVKKGSPVESPRAAARDAEAWHAEPRRPPNMPGWPGPPRVPLFGAGDGRAGANSDGAPAGGLINRRGSVLRGLLSSLKPLSAKRGSRPRHGTRRQVLPRRVGALVGAPPPLGHTSLGVGSVSEREVLAPALDVDCPVPRHHGFCFVFGPYPPRDRRPHSAGAARRGALERQPPSTRAEGAGREGPRNPSRLPARESRPDIPLDDSGRRRSELRRLHAQIPEHMPPRWPGTPNAVLRTTSLGGPRPPGQMGMAARLDQQLGGYDGRVGSPANFHLQSRSPKMLCFGYHLSPISPGMISIVQTTPGGTRWPAPPDSLPPALPCPAPKVRKTVISSLPYLASLPLKVSRLPMMLE